MNNRTMATVYVDRDSISLKTRSRNGCSPQQFIILKKELQRLEEKKYLIAKDIHSYAELRLCDAVDGVKVLEFSFTWLKDAGRDSVSGYTERIRLPYEPFRAYAAGEEETVGCSGASGELSGVLSMRVLGERENLLLLGALHQVEVYQVLVRDARAGGLFLEVVDGFHVDAHGDGTAQPLRVGVGLRIGEIVLSSHGNTSSKLVPFCSLPPVFVLFA